MDLQQHVPDDASEPNRHIRKLVTEGEDFVMKKNKRTGGKKLGVKLDKNKERKKEDEQTKLKGEKKLEKVLGIKEMQEKK